MTKNQKNMLAGLGIVFMLIGSLVPARYFGVDDLSHRILRNIIFFSGLLLFYFTTRETKTDVNAHRTGPLGIFLLCAPTVLGVVAILIAQFFRPGDRMPLATMTDRFFVNLVVAGVPLALIGLPLVAFALFKGALFIRHEGFHPSTSKVTILILIVALGASGYMITKTYGSRGQYKHGSTVQDVVK